MEEDPDASESDASSSDPSDPDPHLSSASRAAAGSILLACAVPLPRSSPSGLLTRLRLPGIAVFLVLSVLTIAPSDLARADGLERVRTSGKLRYGSDMEGGGPYAYPDPKSPRDVTGFEVELMALLGRELGTEPELSQGQWDKLLQVLASGRLDAVINGYEWTETRAREFAATRPYYVYQLQLMVPRTSPLRSWADLKQPRPDGRAWTVGVLVGSAGDTYAAEQGGPNVRVVRFDGATDAMTAVQNGQYDATLQDLPAARFYRERFPGLELVGPPESHGYYVIYTRTGDHDLRDALDQALGRLIGRGDLRRLYEKYGIWTEAQRELDAFTGPLEVVSGRPGERGWELVNQYGSRLLEAAAGHRGALADLDAAGDGPGAGDRDRPALRAGPRPHGARRLRRADPRHAADAPALRALLPAEAAAVDRRDRRAGDQLLGLRGRDLPRRLAGHPRRPDGGRAGAGDVAGAGPAAGDRPPGGADRHPAGDQRLHRPVQGHLGLLGGHPGGADQAVLDPGQQHRRGRSSSPWPRQRFTC